MLNDILALFLGWAMISIVLIIIWEVANNV